MENELDFERPESEFGDGEQMSPVPEGWYAASIFSCQRVTASSGNDMVSVQFAITQPDYANRRVWKNYVCWHETEKTAQNFAREFSRLEDALGVKGAKICEELVGKHLDILVKIEKPTQKNKVSSYRSRPRPDMGTPDPANAPDWF
jgi:hypothetical protein